MGRICTSWLGKVHLERGTLKSLTLFLQKILADLEDLCGTSTQHDLKEIMLRVENEGISFLTISLPNFGSDFQKSLDRGYVARDLFQGYTWRGGLPRLFGGFLELVFARKGGRLLEDPFIPAIIAIRQITLMFAKIGIECTERRTRAAINRYIQCEQDVRDADASLPEDCLLRYKRIGRLLWNDIFQSVDEDIYYGRIVPRHGPGSTADRLSSNAKWIMSEWTQRLERYFPHWEYLIHVDRPLFIERLKSVDVLEPGAERPVRVITVPKTLKTPRIIAIEPACMMFIQQGILNSFEREFARPNGPGKFIRWKSQSPNQAMAREGSEYGNLATLDLSEASDRVSNQHVRALLENFPNLLGGVDSCRSRKADVLGKTIRLAKFASMGSALCFPFESMVFLTIIFCGIEKALNRHLSNKDINSFVGSVRVYGDDIIIPTDYVSSVIAELETFGFRVNSDKSFWTGKFRESCGKEYYAGHDVSIVRQRSMFPTSRKDVEEIISTVAFRNHLYKAGYWKAAAHIDELLESFGFLFPIVGDESPVLGRFSHLGLNPEDTWLDSNYHSPFVKGWVEASKSPEDILDDYGALLKCLTALELREIDQLPVVDEHLLRSGRPSVRRIKLKGAPAV